MRINRKLKVVLMRSAFCRGVGTTICALSIALSDPVQSDRLGPIIVARAQVLLARKYSLKNFRKDKLKQVVVSK